jgi:hypothetical protein
MHVASDEPRRLARAGRSLAALALLGALAAAGPAWAQQDEAETLIKKGLDLRRQGQNLEALPFFQRAYSLFPSSRAGAQLGFVEQAVGLSLEAEKHIAAALADEGDQWVRRNKTAIVQALSEIRASLGKLIVDTSPASATVAINGVVVPARDLQSPIYVKPGNTLLEVRNPGFLTQSRSLLVLAGTTQRQSITLQPGSGGPEAPPLAATPGLVPQPRPGPLDLSGGAPADSPGGGGSGKRTGAIVLGSVAALALVGGTASLLIANNKIDGIDKDARAGARYNVANGNYPTFQRLSQVMYVAGGASLLLAGWLFFSAPSAPEPQAQLAPALVARGAPGLSLSGSF